MKKLPDIIAITETKLAKNQIVVNIDIEGYNFIHSDSSSRAGGVGLYIKDSITFTLKEELDLNINSVENIWIQIETSDNKKPITIGVVYRHPVYVAEQLEFFSKAMEELFSKLSSNNKEFYTMGDFKIDLLKAHSYSFIKNYANNLISYSVKCTINKPTRCTINSKTLLDHIHTNNLKYYNFSGIVQYDISDHLPTFIFVHNTAMKNKVLKDILIRDMKNFSLELFCNDLSLKMNNFKVCEDSPQHHQF